MSCHNLRGGAGCLPTKGHRYMKGKCLLGNTMLKSPLCWRIKKCVVIPSLFCAAGQERLHTNTVIPLADKGSALTHSEGCCICLGWENDVFFVLVEDRKEGEMVGVVTWVIFREKNNASN